MGSSYSWMEHAHQPPILVSHLISRPFAYFLCSNLAFGLVASFYLNPKTIPGGSLRLTKNDSSVIKARMRAFILAVFFGIITVYLVLDTNGGFQTNSIFDRVLITSRLLGFYLPLDITKFLTTLILPILLTGSIYAGYIGEMIVEADFKKFLFVANQYLQPLKTLTGFRDVIFSPIVEEILFRSCMISLLRLANASEKEIIFYSPLLFGIAHLHHLYEDFTLNGRTRRAFLQGLARYLFKSLYTTLFGWYASLLFLRTSSIVPCIFSHGLCNMFGLPLPPYPRGKPLEISSPILSPERLGNINASSQIRQRPVTNKVTTSKSDVLKPLSKVNRHWKDQWGLKLLFVYIIYLAGYVNFFQHLKSWTDKSLYGHGL